jgi:hypothetical protein
MDNVITPTLSRLATVKTIKPAETNDSGSFKELLTAYTDEPMPQQTQAPSVGTLILVGEITVEKPTISELLIQHKELSPSTWNIINSEQNQNRDYTKIQPGTPIYYNRETAALTWSDSRSDSLPSGITRDSIQSDRSGDSNTAIARKPDKDSSAVKQPFVSDEGQSIQIGRIDNSNPTVSHLLKNHPQLRAQTWNLLANSINKDKPFHRIAKGTEIHLNVENMEITWKEADNYKTISHLAKNVVPEEVNLSATIPDHFGRPATDLSEAVQKYLGTSYDEMNCYELLVKGLHQMDIPYTGKDGLFSKLTSMALDKGKAPNAYLNGEGIVKAAGSLVLSKNYADITNWKNEAATLIREIEPLLDNGQILSFSTEKRGHTGIVSKKNNQWTFINSGRLDNSVNRNSLHRGVGEEILNEEISNWFKLAHAKKETLSVTLGQLKQGRIRTASNISESFSKQI